MHCNIRHESVQQWTHAWHVPSTEHIPACSQPPEEPQLLLACKAAQAWHRAADGEVECRQLCMTRTHWSTNHTGNVHLKLHPLKPQDGRGETSSLLYSASRAGISWSDAEAGASLCYLTALLWYPCYSLELQIIWNYFKAMLFITFLLPFILMTVDQSHMTLSKNHIFNLYYKIFSLIQVLKALRVTWPGILDCTPHIQINPWVPPFW